MKIAVLVKQVPGSESPLIINSDHKWVDEGAIAYVMNESDNYALEEALQIRETKGEGEVVVVSLGPVRIQKVIREALAKGADRAIHIQMDSVGEVDPLLTASHFVNVLKEENFDFLEFSYLVAKGRSYSAIPMHGLNGAVMGYYFGLYAFSGNKNYLALSLILPYLFHGFYNFLGWPNMMIVIIVLVIFSLVLHSKLRKLQLAKKKEQEVKKI